MAEELGVHHEALRGWIRQAEADAEPARMGHANRDAADLAAKHRSSVSKMTTRHRIKTETPDGLRTCFEAAQPR
ncbi:hypothetical protein [Streptomyces sp. NPDC050388]|uniref:hypothetical protein n=1 Tax=Streptomyces sp. NPDC050388 TaxID=3155781 RepID=UPI00341E9B6B